MEYSCKHLHEVYYTSRDPSSDLLFDACGAEGFLTPVISLPREDPSSHKLRLKKTCTVVHAMYSHL